MSSAGKTSALLALGVVAVTACGGTDLGARDLGSGGSDASTDGGTGATGGSSGASGAGATGAGGASAGGAHTGGKAGAGGSVAANGGSDAGTVDASPPGTDAGCEDQLTTAGLSWGMNGGLVRYADISYLVSPRTYRHVHDSGGNAPPTCTTEIPGCPSDTLAAIDVALRSKGIAAAISAHALFGVDSRPVDGQVFRISVGTDYVDIGSPCAGAPCVSGPAGLDALVTRLEALDKQELATKACTDVFGPP
jgi:hypothetical protein